jgi:anti-sigma factor RsiW
MLSEDLQLSDQELLLAVDGELPTDRAAQVRCHLFACGVAALGWRKSKGRSPISRELTARLLIPNCHPSPGHVRS